MIAILPANPRPLANDPSISTDGCRWWCSARMFAKKSASCSPRLDRPHGSLEGPSSRDRFNRLEQPAKAAPRRLPIVHFVDDHLKHDGLSIVYPLRKPRPIGRTPQAADQGEISRRGEDRASG